MSKSSKKIIIFILSVILIFTILFAGSAMAQTSGSSYAVYDVMVSQAQYISLRQGPGTEYAEIYRPYSGQRLTITETTVNQYDSRPWGKTTVNGITGWVSLNWTTRYNSATYSQQQGMFVYNNSYTAVISSTDGFANVRTGHSIYSSVIGQLYNGDTIYTDSLIYDTSDNIVWGMINYYGQTAYVAMATTKITNISNAGTAQYTVTVQNANNLKLRKGPGTEYDLLTNYIPSGTSLYITSTVINGFDGRPWGKTYYNGVEGWVSLDWTYRAPGT